MKLHLTTKIELINTETGVAEKEFSEPGLIEAMQAVQNAKNPEDLPPWYCERLKIIRDGINGREISHFRTKAVQVYPEWKKRAQNGLKRKVANCEKLILEKKTEANTTGDRKIENEIKSLRSELKRLKRNQIELDKSLKRISSCPVFYQIKLKNLARQLAVFELKKEII